MRELIEPLLAEISVSMSAETLEARTKGAQLALRGLTADRAQGLAALAHHSQGHDLTLSWLQDRMEGGGEPLHRNHAQEIGILATAILIKAWQNESRSATVAALTVRSGQFLRWKPRVKHLVSLANSYLGRASISVRHPQVISLRRTGFAGTPDELFPEGGVIQMEYVRQLQSSLQEVQEDLASSVEALEGTQRVASEQSSILWWLFGERLLDGRRWSEPREAARPLELARDLFDLYNFLPEPRGSVHFLMHSMGHGGVDPDRELTVAGTLREVAQDSLVRDIGIPKTETMNSLPIIGALHHLDLPDGTQPGRLRRSALEIAEQLGTELQIAHIIGTASDE